MSRRTHLVKNKYLICKYLIDMLPRNKSFGWRKIIHYKNYSKTFLKITGGKRNFVFINATGKCNTSSM